MLNGVNAAQWRKNGMMEVGEGKVVGDVRGCGWCYGDRCNGMIMMTINMKKKIIIKIIIMIIIVMELRIMEC